jgi:hypothetical protein
MHKITIEYRDDQRVITMSRDAMLRMMDLIHTFARLQLPADRSAVVGGFSFRFMEDQIDLAKELDRELDRAFKS